MGSLRHEHRDLGLPFYPCARLRIWFRETVPATLFRYRTWFYLQEVIIPRSRERGLILCKLSTNAVQAPHELPLDRNASRYTQCRVRKQSNECESEKRLVKSQRSGVALTERGGSWGLDGSCFAAIAAERPLCPNETISPIFFQPFASTGLYQLVRNFRSILEHVSFRSPSWENAPIIFFGPELEWNRINLDSFSVRAIAHVRHLSLFFINRRASAHSTNLWNVIQIFSVHIFSSEHQFVRLQENNVQDFSVLTLAPEHRCH